MNLEDKIKESLMKHAEDVRPDVTSWDAVEGKLRRAHYARVVMVSTLTVALIAAAAVVIPRLGTTKNPSSGFSSPGASTTASSLPAPEIKGTVHASPVYGFKITIPDGWRAGFFEGVYEYGPENLPMLAQGGDTFAVTVDILHGRYDSFSKDIANSNAGTTTQQTTVKGHAAEQVQLNNDPTRQMWLFLDWDSCLKGAPQCTNPEEGITLQVHVSANTKSLWDKYGSTAAGVMGSIDTYDGSRPVHGTLASDETDDVYTRALVRFMDARAEGVGAEDLVCCTAASQADMYYSVGTLDLSGWTDLGGRTVSASTATSTYRVDVIAGQGTETSHHVESITVGYKSGQQSDTETPVVLDVKLEQQ